MPKLLQINPVIRRNTSTGKIMQEIGELVTSRGWESWVAYSRGRDGVPGPESASALKGSKLLPVGSRLSVALHGLETRLLDRHGLGSRLATLRFVREIKHLDPDVIHIHNIHGYFLNYKILFRYLAECGKPVIWTVHDCWLYTGHCYHYSAAHCFKWKTGCKDCCQRREFPSSWFFDRSAANYRDKSESFNSVPKDKLTIVPVSEWMGNELKASFLGKCNIKVIHNGIDTDTFAPQDSAEIRNRYGIGDRKVILGLASIWMKEKGFDDFIKISEMLNDDEVIVMVGKMSEEQKNRLPKDIITIARTDNVQQLAELYSAATAFVNPTWQDNYPTVNLEAMSCGTPVITYRTGGSIEAITDDTGFIVEQGDIQGLLDCVRTIERQGKNHYSGKCRDRALKNFKKKDRYEEYFDLYNSCLRK